MKNGFSFLLVSVALVVGTLSFSNSIRFSSGLKYTIQEKGTAEKMQKIENALISFVSKNGRLPCPALLSNKLEDPAFGTEAVDTSFNCLNTDTNLNITSGMVPIKTLGLAISDIEDGYGNKIGYAASLPLTKSINQDANDNYSNALGNIIVQTDAGKTLTEQAAFIIISDGKNKSSEAQGNLFTSGSSENMDDIILFKEKDQLVSSCLNTANAVNCSLATCSNSASAFNWSNSSIGYINQKPALILDGKVDLPKLSLDNFRQSNQFQLQFTAEVEKATEQEIILYYTYALRGSPTEEVTEKLLTLNQSSSGLIEVTFGAYDHLPGTLFFKLADPGIKNNLRIRLYDLKITNLLPWRS